MPVSALASVSAKVAGPVTVRVRAVSTKFTMTAALWPATVVVRVTAPPLVAAVGPSSASAVPGASAVRVTVMVWSGSVSPKVSLTGSARLRVAVVSPAGISTLPLWSPDATL